MDSVRVINDVPTRLLTFGPGIDVKECKDANYIVVLIPGNPGVIEYYREFMSKIYEELSSTFDGVAVWGISHAGHQIEGTEEHQYPDLSLIPSRYDLEGQIKHKEAFLALTIPAQAQLIFIGHSIGCKIILEVLKRQKRLAAQVAKSYLLFPTIERMRDTPNGQMLWPLSSMRWLTTAFIWPLSLLPQFVQKGIVSLYLYNRNAPDCIKKATLELFHLDVFRRFITMGFSELEQVYTLDHRTLIEFNPKLFFYFGTTDRWCPLQFAYDLKRDFPDLEHKICTQGFDHAFVISSSVEMAVVLTPHIKQVISGKVE